MGEISNKETNETKETSESSENKEMSTRDKLHSLDKEKQDSLNKELNSYRKEHPDATREDVKEHFAKRIDDEYKSKNGETGEKQEFKKLSTSEKFDSLSEKEKYEVLGKQQEFQRKNPYTSSEEVGKYNESLINDKYRENNPEYEKKAFVAEKNRVSQLAKNEALTNEDKKEMRNDIKLVKNSDDMGKVADKYEERMKLKNENNDDETDDDERSEREKNDDLQIGINKINESKHFTKEEKAQFNYAMKATGDKVTTLQSYEKALEKREAEAKKKEEELER